MTDPTARIVITALGAITPVGATAEQSCAAIAAGVARFHEHAYYQCAPEDPEWDEPLPLFVSDVPVLDPFLDGPDRLLQLALPALSEVMAQSKLKRRDLEQCGLMLSLPEADAATTPLNLSTQFVPALCQLTGLTTFKLWKTSQTGHTGVFTLIQSALQKLKAGDIKMCIVGGVDSYLLETRLDTLDAAWRLRSSRTVDGFIPGEAAVMLLLETAAHAKARGATILATLNALGEATESETIHSQKNSTGEGLTQAIETALNATQPPPGIDTVYGSLNGESYYAFEWGVTLTRLNAALATTQPLIHPADAVGDIGAATGGLLLACATEAFKKHPEAHATSLVWTSANNGHRMALTLQKGEG
jgi:3-oxoacyl-[acyl-carrier-protein] synthase I